MTLLREARCPECGASVRQSHVAQAIMRTLKGEEHPSLKETASELRDLAIYEADSSGAIHEVLKGLPNYVCSEFMGDIGSGEVKGGIRSENLTRLTFADNSFDLVITQDVLEHVSDFKAAFLEVRRVLKRGGYHIFTVPIHEGRNTVVRAEEAIGGEIRHLMPAVRHGDPLRAEGALVFTDFGDDIISHLNDIGLQTERIKCSDWYGPEDVTIVTGDNYGQYEEAFTKGSLASFFKYNSIVLISKKTCLPFTGERYVPEIGGQLAYEHLHRYAFALEYVPGKTVLDIASGEGYGSCLLSKEANKVVGVDISDESIAHAKAKYAGHENLEFISGTATNIPCERELFDIVVSFETIEHLAEQHKMLDEVKRVLRKDGLLIISSPNKEHYKEHDAEKNEHHITELTLDEFAFMLRSRFSHVRMMGQRMTHSSHIWPLDGGDDDCRFTHYTGDASSINASARAPYDALYSIAICSDDGLAPGLSKASLFTGQTDSLYKYYTEILPAEHDRRISRYRDSLSWKISAPVRWLYEKLRLMGARIS